LFETKLNADFIAQFPVEAEKEKGRLISGPFGY
jgi:hypothetical protein